MCDCLHLQCFASLDIIKCIFIVTIVLDLDEPFQTVECYVKYSGWCALHITETRGAEEL